MVLESPYSHIARSTGISKMENTPKNASSSGKEMHLCYTGGMFYVNVRLAIDHLLAKLAKRIYNLQH